MVSYNDFKKLDIRVVKVIDAHPIPGKTKIVRLVVDVGSSDFRTMIAGGAEFYPLQSFIGKTFVAIINLAPKRIAGVLSQGMLLAANVSGKPVWLEVKEAPVGARIT